MKENAPPPPPESEWRNAPSLAEGIDLVENFARTGKAWGRSGTDSGPDRLIHAIAVFRYVRAFFSAEEIAYFLEQLSDEPTPFD